MSDAILFVKANGPQFMVEIDFDESRLRTYSFQPYADSASFRTHWHLSDPYIREVM